MAVELLRGRSGFRVVFALLLIALPAWAAAPLVTEVSPRSILPGGTLVVKVHGEHGAQEGKGPEIGFRSLSAAKGSNFTELDSAWVHVTDSKSDALTFEVVLPEEKAGPGSYELQLSVGDHAPNLGVIEVVAPRYAREQALIPLALFLIVSIAAASALRRRGGGQKNPGGSALGNLVGRFFQLEFNPLTLIETRDKEWRSYSLSKFQMLLWTVVVGGLFIYVFRVRHELLDLPENFLWLMGVASASTVGAKALDDRTLTIGDNSQPREPRLTDLISEDGEFSLTRMQMLFWTVVLAFAVVKSSATSLALPTLSDHLVLLMGVSHGAYLFAKAAQPRPPPDQSTTNSVQPPANINLGQAVQAAAQGMAPVDQGVAGPPVEQPQQNPNVRAPPNGGQ
jgi:hypothetical protein